MPESRHPVFLFGLRQHASFPVTGVLLLCALASWAQDVRAPSQSAYVLENGDDLEVKVQNIPELNQAARVRPDGKISLLLLNDVQAAGLTATQLATFLNSAYGDHYRNPRVAVMVASFSRMNVYVGGEVGHPGLVPLRGDITALQAVVQAGGLKDTSHPELTVLRKAKDGGTETIRMNVAAIVSGKSHDVVLQPADVIYVAKSNIEVYVGGEVTRPGLLPLNGQLTATAAIVQAGGFRESARRNSVLLLRNSGTGSPLVTTLRLDDVLKGKADVSLAPYDVIYVPKSKIGKVDTFVSQYIRQVLPVSLSAGFSYLFGTTFVQ